MTLTCTILLISADPYNNLDPESEYRAIKDAIRFSRQDHLWRVVSTHQCTIQDFQNALQEHNPSILHLCGYGDSEGLTFHNDQYDAEGDSNNEYSSDDYSSDDDSTDNGDRYELGYEDESFVNYDHYNDQYPSSSNDEDDDDDDDDDDDLDVTLSWDELVDILRSAQLSCVILSACDPNSWANRIARASGLLVTSNDDIDQDESREFLDIFYQEVGNGDNSRRCFRMASSGESVTPEDWSFTW